MISVVVGKTDAVFDGQAHCIGSIQLSRNVAGKRILHRWMDIQLVAECLAEAVVQLNHRLF